MRRKITRHMLEQFSASLSENEKSEQTVEKYLRDVRCFVQFADGRHINKEMILEYKSKLERRYAVSSANSMIAALNAFFRFAGWQDYSVKQFRVQRKAFCSEEKELTKAEYASLVRTAERQGNERLSLLLQTICGTGIRVSEVQFITVKAVERGEAIVSCKSKTRSVFIIRELRQKLLAYCRKNQIEKGQVFITKSGNAMSRIQIWRQMKALCAEAGVNPDKVFPHNLRHLFARVFYGIEKDIAKLADILGHSSIDTTRLYIITTGTEHRRKMEIMHLIL